MSGSLFENTEFGTFAPRWLSRSQELQRRAGYYDGAAYRKHNLGWLAPRLYRGVKALYLPLSRAVDVDCGIIPGGWAFPEDAPEAWDEAASYGRGRNGLPMAYCMSTTAHNTA